jgi:chaperonin GroES
MNKLEALFNAVIVKPIEVEEQRVGNIIVPDMDQTTKNRIAEVVSVGPGAHSVTGTFIPSILKVGDKVVLPTMTFTKFEFEGEEYLIGRENDILSKVNI